MDDTLEMKSARLITVLGLVAALSCPPMARAEAPQLDVLHSEDGVPASHYTSQHRLTCGGRLFELAVESPGPVRLTALEVDGVAIAPAQLKAINAQAPERSWFRGIVSSCTSLRQSLTLQLSSPQGEVTIPLSFKDGVLGPVPNR